MKTPKLPVTVHGQGPKGYDQGCCAETPKPPQGFRNSQASGQTPPSETLMVSQNKQQAGTC